MNTSANAQSGAKNIRTGAEMKPESVQGVLVPYDVSRMPESVEPAITLPQNDTTSTETPLTTNGQTSPSFVEVVTCSATDDLRRWPPAGVSNPYYVDESVCIIHGDCQEILPSLPKVDLVLTDPPYPNMDGRVSEYRQTPIDFLATIKCRQFVFWHSHGSFPLTFQAVHIWDKKTGCQSEYERIFERNGENGHWKMFRHYLINSTVAANYTGDTFTGHYSQKPIRLIKELLKLAPETTLVLDPFMGSGTTLRAAKDLGRKAIGIEIEERYCEIAARRMSQGVLPLYD